MNPIQASIAELKEMLRNQNYLLKTFLSVTETADYLDLSISEIYKKSSNKDLPRYKTGKRVLFKRTEIDQWVQNHRIRSQEEIQKEIHGLTKKINSHGK